MTIEKMLNELHKMANKQPVVKPVKKDNTDNS
jgi:hypothetical protein